MEIPMISQILKSLDGTESLLDDTHCKQLNMLEERMAEDIYLLILNYYVENTRGKKGSLSEGRDIPYGAAPISKDNKGLKFKVSQLPDDVQRLIVQYLKLVSC